MVMKEEGERFISRCRYKGAGPISDQPSPSLQHISHLDSQPLRLPLHQHIAPVYRPTRLRHRQDPSRNEILRQLHDQAVASLGREDVHRHGQVFLVVGDVAEARGLADREDGVGDLREDGDAAGAEAVGRARRAGVLVALVDVVRVGVAADVDEEGVAAGAVGGRGEDGALEPVHEGRLVVDCVGQG